MRLLLDTHVFLWYITGDQRLSSHFRGDNLFDPMLVSQALGADLLLVTVDPVVAKYSVPLLAPPSY